jgi:hypothetical protein
MFVARQIAPRGFEPLSGNQQPPNNKRLTENHNPVLATGLDKIMRHYPELRELVKVWPILPEHIRATIRALVGASKTSKKEQL